MPVTKILSEWSSGDLYFKDKATRTTFLTLSNDGTVNIVSPKINGTALSATATELNKLGSVTAGTASASKAVVLDASKGVIGLGPLTVGAFHSTTQGSGIAVNAAATAAVRVYADDAGAALTPSGAVPDLKVVLGRYLVTADQSAIHARVWGVMGQTKVYDALWNEEQLGGVNGRLEVVQSAGTTTLAGYGISAGVQGIFATAGTVLVNTNHVAAGVAAIADIKGTVTQTGVVAGVYVGKYDTTNWSDATSRASWTYGVYVAASSCTTGISVGTCTTGIALSGTQATGMSIATTISGAANGRSLKIDGTLAAAAHADGYGTVEINANLSGTVAGPYACASSTWINLVAAAVPGSQILAVQNNGIYAPSGITHSSATYILGSRLQYVADDGAQPAQLFLFDTNIYNGALTALFQCNALSEFTPGSVMSTGGISIPLFRSKTGAQTYYVNVYTS